MLLGLGSWLAWSGGGSTDWVEVAYQGSAEALAGDADLESGESEPAGVEGEGEVEDPSGSSRRALQGAETVRAVAPGSGFEVRVVDGRNGQPVAGAELRFWDTLMPGFQQFRRARGRYRIDKEPVLTKYGEMVRSDSRGIAYLPHGIPVQQVSARKGQLYGEATVSRPKGPPKTGYEVRLFPDHSLRVQVLNASGEPQRGLEICFNLPLPGPRGQIYWTRVPAGKRRDDSDAVQEFPHVQVGLEALLQRNPDLAKMKLGVNIPGATALGPQIAVTDFPIREVLQIKLPALAQLRVKVEDSDGLPVQRRIRLRAPLDFDYPGLAPAEMARYQPSWDLNCDPQGQVLFPALACGLEGEVFSLGPRVMDSERAAFVAPAEPGGVGLVRLLRPLDQAYLLVQALDAERRPLADTELDFEVRAKAADREAAFLRRGRQRSDAQGYLRIRVAASRIGPPTRPRPGKAPRPAPRFNVYQDLRLRSRGGGGPQVRAMIPLPAQLAPGTEHRLEAQLVPPPLLIAGRVYLDDAPLPRFNRFLVDQRDAANKNRWKRRQGLQVLADRSGRFSVYGEPGQGALRLLTRSWGFLPVLPMEFTPGRTDAEVRIYRAGALRVAVLHDAPVKDAPLELMLVPVHLPGVEVHNYLRSRFIGRVDRGRSGNLSYRRVYRWTGLPRGSFRLEVRLQGQPLAFETLDQPPISYQGDPRHLEPLVVNLIGRLKRFRVRTLDPRNRGIAALLQPLRQEGSEAEELVSLGRRGGEVFTTLDSVDIKVMAKGYRPKILYGLREDVTLRLEPGIPIDVHLPQLRLPRGVGVEVRLRRRASARDRRFRVGLRHYLGAGIGTRRLDQLVGEQQVLLRHRGRRHYRGTLMLHGDFVLDLLLRRKGHKPVRLRGYGPRLLKVRDVATVHRMTVRTPRRRIEAALKELGLELQPRQKRGAGKKKQK